MREDKRNRKKIIYKEEESKNDHVNSKQWRRRYKDKD